MLKSSFVCTLALGAALLVGCNKDETTPSPTPPAPTNPPKQPQATGTGIGEEMKKADTAAHDTVNKASDTASKTAGDTAKGTADAAKTSTDTVAASATDTAATAEQTSLMNQVQQYIKEKKFDDADAALTKLEGMQDKLPAQIKSQLPTARQAIDTGKKLTGSGTPAAPSSADLPKVPGLNK